MTGKDVSMCKVVRNTSELGGIRLSQVLLENHRGAGVIHEGKKNNKTLKRRGESQTSSTRRGKGRGGKLPLPEGR